LKALRTGRSQLVPEFSEALMEAVAKDAEHLSILRSLNYKSAIAVPLVARERTLGAITLLFAESERRYGPTDLPLAEELAQRAALAVDNARLYREAQQAIRLRDEFLAVAAHELKTPVTSLKGMAQLALRRLDREGRLEPQQARQALGTIERQSDKLGRLVSQLLDISRIQAGQLAISPQAADLRRVVEDAVAVAQASTTRHQIMLDVPSTIEARVDPLRLEQVLLNLLDNAVRYSPEGGRIDVGLYPVDAQTARVEVRDHGPGIPPPQRDRIFDRFFQAHPGSHLDGIGLGLYISRQIIELHRGRIEADFPDDGGTRFVVTLPTGL
jgi:signal transduction histidine kinase